MPASATDPLLTTLRDTFGFPGFRAGQEAVVRALLHGRSALAIFPTGAGKSLCYQLAALQLPGLTVVVSPLIALMKDQLEFLEARNIPAARVDSTRDAASLRRTAADLRSGRLKLLYASPERLGNERFLATLRGAGTISLLVVDEAHCISEWGHNFRPDYLKLARLAETLGVERVLALTATATPAVADDIARAFGIAERNTVRTGFHRPNLFLRVTPTSRGEALPQLIARLRERRPAGAAVVYVTLQKTAENVAQALVAAGIEARPYHAGLEDEQRNATQDWFMRGSAAPIVVATIAFGMGIDKSDLRAVYHFNLPKSLENYAQEIGRAGRDGLPAECELFACADDLLALENFSYGDTPEPSAIAALTNRLLLAEDKNGDDAAGDTFDISFLELADEFDIRPLVVGTLMTYLELAGVIAATAPFYREYAFAPQRPSAEILAEFSGERGEFLRAVFRLAKRGTKWFKLNLQEAAEQIPGATRERLVRAFNYLEEHGDLEVKPTGLRQAYRRLRQPTDDELRTLRAELARRFQTRESNDLARLRRVVEFAEAPGCLTRRLVAYFGEELAANCGHCVRCAGDPAVALPPRSVTLSPRKICERLSEIARLAEAHPHALGTTRQRARFACGLSSPRASRARLTRANPLFGCLAEVPFGEVLKAAAS